MDVLKRNAFSLGEEEDLRPKVNSRMSIREGMRAYRPQDHDNREAAEQEESTKSDL